MDITCHNMSCGKPTGQNIAGSFFESRSERRQHSIERDSDLHEDMECLKKKGKYFTIEVSKYTQRSAEYFEIFI